MPSVDTCPDPRHIHITDYEAKEVICKQCGGVVVEDETKQLRSNMGIVSESETTATDHYRTNNSLIIREGTQLHYTSPGNPGVFKLGDPYRLKDAEKKHCKPVLTPGLAYQLAYSLGHNGDWEGNRFITNYERDMWFAKCSEERRKLLEKYRIAEVNADRIAKKDLHGYSTIIIDLMPELITRLSINTLPAGRIAPKDREDNRGEAMKLLSALAGGLHDMLQVGDDIADREAGYEVAEPPQEEKKRIGLVVGPDDYSSQDLEEEI